MCNIELHWEPFSRPIIGVQYAANARDWAFSRDILEFSTDRLISVTNELGKNEKKKNDTPNWLFIIA